MQAKRRTQPPDDRVLAAGRRSLPGPGSRFGLTALLSCLALMASLAGGAGGQDQTGAEDRALASPDELYRRGSELFYEARFESALQDIDLLLETPDLPARDRIRGLELRGACEIAQSNRMAARRTVEAILDLDPAYTMDPKGVFPPLLRVFFEVLKERGALAVPPGIRSVALVPLQNSSVTEHEAMQALGIGLAQALASDIVGASEVRVVERERLRYVLEEIERPSGLLDRETAARAGRLVGAQSFLMGNYTRIGDRLRIDVRLVETETGVVLKTRSVQGKVDHVFDMTRDLAKEVVEDLGAVYSRPVSRADAGLRALMEYAAGLDLLDQGRLAEAEAHLQQALAHHPDYTEARSLLRQIRPMMAAQEISR